MVLCVILKQSVYISMYIYLSCRLHLDELLFYFGLPYPDEMKTEKKCTAAAWTNSKNRTRCTAAPHTQNIVHSQLLVVCNKNFIFPPSCKCVCVYMCFVVYCIRYIYRGVWTCTAVYCTRYGCGSTCGTRELYIAATLNYIFWQGRFLERTYALSSSQKGVALH